MEFAADQRSTHPIWRHTRPRIWAWLRAALPEGRALPEPVWRGRHRGIIALIWLQAAGLAVFAIIRGADATHAVLEAAIPATLGALAYAGRGRKMSASLASIGLLLCSAILVHASGGVIEMHFHFFVMLGVIALYQDWVPYLVAIGFVALHHAGAGFLDPTDVYNHAAAREQPFLWAAVHAVFVLAMSTANLVTWRLNERYRAQADRAHQQEAVAELSRLALTSPPFAELSAAATKLLTSTLDLEFAAVAEWLPDANSLVMRAATGWDDQLLHTRTAPANADSHVGATLASDRPVVIEDLATDDRFGNARFLHEAGVRSGAGAVISGSERAYGVLSVHSVNLRPFDAQDLSFLEAIANTLSGALRHNRAEEELIHQALHDPLTGLPNRALFKDRLDHALGRARRADTTTAIALLDLDNFKSVNDTRGHPAGDELLVVIARRLEGCLRPGDTIARLGGDEFVVLLEETSDAEALAVADRILRAVNEPVSIEGRMVVIGGSIGLSSSRHDEESGALLRNADLAMYAAKSAGKGRIEVFHSGMYDAVLARVELEADLRHALENALGAGQLRLLYQPKVSLVSERMIGVEALVRWEHPERGLIAPLDFIPMAEETGLIIPIGAWILEEACRQALLWNADITDGRSLTVSVNVSARQFEGALVETVRHALTVTGVDPAVICLEVTETVIMKNVEMAIATLVELSAMGVKLSIDDFGTGYSSLTYLKQFPLNELKVDKSFVDGLGVHREDEAIVAAILGLAEALGLEVVAEGVESLAQAAFLRTLGCGTAQGYHFDRPQPASKIDAMLTGRSAAVSDEAPEHAPAMSGIA